MLPPSQRHFLGDNTITITVNQPTTTAVLRCQGSWPKKKKVITNYLGLWLQAPLAEGTLILQPLRRN